MSLRKDFGTQGESLVASMLEKKGYKIIARNYKKMYGEIDLIAQKDSEVVFVEVKTRSNSYIEPENLISPAQQRKIIATAKAYVAEYDLIEYVWRFDAALLIGIPPHQKLTYIPNAFIEEE
jgi:putative endonuclease